MIPNMSTSSVQVERRVGQRFPFLLPVSFRTTDNAIVGVGFTQDVGSRGALFLTDAPLKAGITIELTLNMPAEITLGDSMRVRCRGHILRVARPGAKNSISVPPADSKVSVAVRFDEYEYLPDSLPAPSRLSALRPEPSSQPTP